MSIQATIQAKWNTATELYGQARAILDEYGDKPMPQEKQSEVDRLFSEFDKAEAEAKRFTEAMKRESAIAAFNEPSNDLDAPKTTPKAASSEQGNGKAGDEQAALEAKAWGRALRGGTRVLTEAQLKALRADNDPAGGYLVAPQQVVQQLIAFVDDMVFIRRMATVYPLASAESLGVPVLDSDLDDPTWTSELETGSEDTAAPFARRELKPAPLAKRIKLSKKLLRQSTINVENLVRERIGYKFGVAQEKAYLTGTGVNQPLGVFTASTAGISTGRDTACASQTAVVGDDLINCKHELKAAYWPNARWLFHRDLLKMIRKLKDQQNNYLWSPGLGPGGGLTGGNPATILDVPYDISEFAPNTFTTGKYVAILANWKWYWIAEALNLEIQVVMELYAETNQVGYIARQEVDGMPVHEEAFRRLKLA